MIQGFPKKKDLMLDPGGDIDSESLEEINTEIRERNRTINECKSAVMKMLDKEKIEKLLKDMCFDLVSKGEIAQAIVDYMKGGESV